MLGFFYLYLDEVDLVEQTCGTFAHLDAHPIYREALKEGSDDLVGECLYQVVFLRTGRLLHKR